MMFHLQVLTPEEIIFDGRVTSIIAPGKDGYLGILADHTPIIVALKQGILEIIQENETLYYEVSAGFLEMDKNEASVLVKTATVTDAVDLGMSGGI